MNGSTQKVGRITVAAGLVIFGAALLVDNLTGIQTYTSLVVKLWPLLLVGFGAEYLIRSLLSSREGGQEVRLRFDIGGAFLLVLVVMLSMGVVTFQSWMINPRGPLGFGPSQSVSQARTLAAAGTKELQADVPAGSLHLEPSVRGDEIRVEATYTAHGFLYTSDEALQRLNQIKLNVTEGETTRLSVDLPENLVDVTVRFVIYAPPGLKVKADTRAGSVEVRGYTGDLQLTTQVGRIDVDSSSGSVSAASSSGFISIRSFTGPLAAKTNVGGMNLEHLNGPVQLESGTGSINVSDFQGGKLVAENQMGGIHVSTLSPLQGDVILKSQTGQVNLTLPKESSMRATAQIRSGSLAVPPFMSRNRDGAGETAVGTLGDGKYTVSLEAGTGSVHLNMH